VPLELRRLKPARIRVLQTLARGGEGLKPIVEAPFMARASSLLASASGTI
jgi:hypothetical protein